MTYVVQYPNSQTNPSGKYRVTEFGQWMAYINHAQSGYAFVPYDTLAQAEAARDEMNRSVAYARRGG